MSSRSVIRCLRRLYLHKRTNSVNSVATLICIIKAIRTYCYQTSDYRDPAESESINAYLKVHLSSQSWLCWQRLRPLERAAFVNNQDLLPYNAPSLNAFYRRLKEYEGTIYAPFKFWYQAENNVRTELMSLTKN